MSTAPEVHERLRSVTSRLAHTTSAFRARADDVVRTEVNGGTTEELLGRMEAAVSELEKATAKFLKDL